MKEIPRRKAVNSGKTIEQNRRLKPIMPGEHWAEDAHPQNRHPLSLIVKDM
jgi:hypothetical protein